MQNVSTRPHAGATPAAAPSAQVRAIKAERIPFDSSAIDVITQQLTYIRGLADCASCLAAVPDGVYGGYELSDESLTLLNRVIVSMADTVREAADKLWEQYGAARDIANGEVQS